MSWTRYHRHVIHSHPQFNRSYAAMKMIPWSYCWCTLGKASQALGLTNGAAVTTWPAEIGGSGADMTRDAAGPVWRSSVSQMGGRPAIETSATHLLRTAAAAITIALPYSIFACIRVPSGNVGGIIGGQTNVASLWYPLAFGNFAIGAGGGTMDTTIACDSGYHRIASVITSTTDKGYVDGATLTVSGSIGNTLPTRLAVGGPADLAASVLATQCWFLGVYQGDISAHPRFRALMTVTKA